MSGDSAAPLMGPVEYSPKEERSVERAHAENLLGRVSGVEGVGEGQDALGNPAWIAYVRDRAVAGKLPDRIGERAVVPEVSGIISALPIK
jgi:hypothetical protein